MNTDNITHVCMHIHVGLLRVLTVTVLLSIPAILTALHEYFVKLSFCSTVKTFVGMPLMVVLATLSEIIV